MVNYLFIFMFIIGMAYGIVTGRTGEITSAILNTPKESMLVFFDISCLMIFWSGVLEVCKESGMLNLITKYIKKLIHPLFRGIDKDEKALDYISMNFAANIMGVGSAATPFGLKAMQELHRLNDFGDVASKDMITLLVINTSGLCIIPSTIVALREAYGSTNSSLVIPYILILSILTSIFAITINGVFKRGS